MFVKIIVFWRLLLCVRLNYTFSQSQYILLKHRECGINAILTIIMINVGLSRRGLMYLTCILKVYIKPRTQVHNSSDSILKMLFPNSFWLCSSCLVKAFLVSMLKPLPWVYQLVIANPGSAETTAATAEWSGVVVRPSPSSRRL